MFGLGTLGVHERLLLVDAAAADPVETAPAAAAAAASELSEIKDNIKTK